MAYASPIRGRRVSASRFRIDQSIKETHHEQSFRKDRPRHRRLARHRSRQRTRTGEGDRKSTRLNSSHSQISYAVFCLKKKKKKSNTELDMNQSNHTANERIEEMCVS